MTDPLTLISTKATGKFIDLALSYQYQVRSGSAVVYDSGVIAGAELGAELRY